MFCPNCGEKVKDGAAFCHCCGTSVTSKLHPVSSEWDAVASSLANGSLGLAKGLMWMLGGGMVLACGCSALGLLAASCYLIYHFAKGIPVAVPSFVTSSLSITTIHGIGLLFSGVTSAFIAMLLIMAANALMKGILSIKIGNRR